MFDEELESLENDEERALKDKFTELERRLNQLELESEDGYSALKNQKRLMFYLEELSRILEEELGMELPDVPTLDQSN